jgi:hypothetical protein
MTWGALITLLLRALPEILFLWRRRVERGDKEAIHEDVQLFREAICSPAAPNNGGRLDRAAVLLERRVREARELRQRRSHAD